MARFIRPQRAVKLQCSKKIKHIPHFWWKGWKRYFCPGVRQGD